MGIGEEVAGCVWVGRARVLPPPLAVCTDADAVKIIR